MGKGILLVTELFPPAVGGSATLLASVYGRITRMPVTVLSGTQGSSRGDLGFQVQHVEMDGSRRGVRSAAELRQHLGIARQIRSRGLGSNVVHAARPLPEGLAALAAASMWPRGPQYVCWAHGEELTAALTSREHGWLAKRVCRGAAAVIASSENAGRIVRGLGVPAPRVHVIYPGVDSEQFRPDIDGSHLRQRLAPNANFILLSVGRLQRRKGHDLTIEAVAMLAAELPGLHYVIAGSGLERERLEALSAARGIVDRVHFTGDFPTAELPALYAACDLFVLPTRQDEQDIEGFGIVFLEAAAAGKAAVGGNNGGVPEAVAAGQTGSLVDGHDAAELARTIRMYVEAPDLLSRMGEAGRRRVIQSFTWERAASLVTELHTVVATA